MRKMATRDAVFEAAAQLEKDGQDPSSRTVRNFIGGGSLATIQRYLREWRGESDSGAGQQTGSASKAEPRSNMEQTGSRALVAQDQQNGTGAGNRTGTGNMTGQAPGDDRIGTLIQAVAGLRADIAATSGAVMTSPPPDARIEELTRAVADLRRQLDNSRQQPASQDQADSNLRLAVEMGHQIGTLQSQVEGLRETVRTSLAEVQAGQEKPEAELTRLVGEVAALREDLETAPGHEQLREHLDSRTLALQDQIGQLQRHLEQALERQDENDADDDGRIDQLLRAVIGLRTDFESIVARQAEEAESRSGVGEETGRRLDDVQQQIAELGQMVRQALQDDDSQDQGRIDALTRAVIGLRTDFENLADSSRQTDSGDAVSQMSELRGRFEELGDELRLVMSDAVNSPRDREEADPRIDDLLRAVIGLRADFEMAGQRAENRSQGEEELGALQEQIGLMRDSLQHALAGGLAEIINREMQVRDDRHLQAAAESDRRAEQLQTQLDKLRESLDGALSGGLVNALSEAMEARAAERESAMIEAESRLHATMLDQFQTIRQSFENLCHSLDRALETGVADSVAREIGRGVQGLQDALDRMRLQGETDLRALKDHLGQQTDGQIEKLARDFQRLESRLDRLTERDLPETVARVITERMPQSTGLPDIDGLVDQLADRLQQTLPQSSGQPVPETLTALQQEVGQLRGVMSSVISLVSRQDDPVPALAEEVRTLRAEMEDSATGLKRNQKQGMEEIHTRLNALSLQTEARIEATSEGRLAKLFQDFEGIQTDLKMAALSMKPLQQELRRLNAERDTVVAERGRSQGERDAAVAERDRIRTEMQEMKALMADMRLERDRARELTRQAAEDNEALRRLAEENGLVPPGAAASWTAEALQYEGLSRDQLTPDHLDNRPAARPVAAPAPEEAEDNTALYMPEDAAGDEPVRDDMEEAFDAPVAWEQGAEEEDLAGEDDAGYDEPATREEDFLEDPDADLARMALDDQEPSTRTVTEPGPVRSAASPVPEGLSPAQATARAGLLALIGEENGGGSPSDIALADAAGVEIGSGIPNGASLPAEDGQEGDEPPRDLFAGDSDDDIAIIAADAEETGDGKEDPALASDAAAPVPSMPEDADVADDIIPDDDFIPDDEPLDQPDAPAALSDSPDAEDDFALSDDAPAEMADLSDDLDINGEDDLESLHAGLEALDEDSQPEGRSRREQWADEDVSFDPGDLGDLGLGEPEPATDEDEAEADSGPAEEPALILSETLSDQSMDFSDGGDIHPIADALDNGPADDDDFLSGDFELDDPAELPGGGGLSSGPVSDGLDGDDDDFLGLDDDFPDIQSGPAEKKPAPKKSAAPAPALESDTPDFLGIGDDDDDFYEDDSDISDGFDDDFGAPSGSSSAHRSDGPLDFGDFDGMDTASGPGGSHQAVIDVDDEIEVDGNWLDSSEVDGMGGGGLDSFLDSNAAFPDDMIRRQQEPAPSRQNIPVEDDDFYLPGGDDDDDLPGLASAPSDEPFLGFDLESEEFGDEDIAPPAGNSNGGRKRPRNLDDVFSDLPR